jgi:hypothetical protein
MNWFDFCVWKGGTMARHSRERIHRILDGEENGDDIKQHREQQELTEYRAAIEALEQSKITPPEDFVSRVMASLPDGDRVSFFEKIIGWWPRDRQWLVPAASGAAVALLLVALGSLILGGGTTDQILVTFELHAPQAQSVELIGSFNDWTRGTVHLSGPDASGHWAVTIPLPSGRHEYQFLVDGERLVADPKALLYRPDGFGQNNAVLDI